MPIIKIPTPLRTYTKGNSEVTLKGDTVAKTMQDLIAQHPALRPHLYNPEGNLRPYVNIFLDDENVRDLQGLETPLQESDRLRLIPSIAGGVHAA
ncbi:MAG: MoaD/ThiS family protein [Anaerolineales bacterium]|nr:MoaD/ThiS family protein [Anaerolineales bacterium]